MSTMRKLRKLGPADWLELLRAQVALVAAQVTVWRRPRGQLVSGAAEATRARPGGGGAPAREAEARRIALAVRRAAFYGIFRPLCLVRAVALHEMLESRGIGGSEVRVGVRWVGRRFAAHAWVEYGDLILGDDDEHVGSFATLPDIQVKRQG